MTNPIYDTSKPALVTGATGYIAGWLVKGLLEQGITVHAAVRDPSNKEKLAHLTALVKDNPEQLKFFKADLLNDGAYDEAMAGCGVVFHTASPFTSSFKDAQKELVDPAVSGTRNVLETANRTDSVSRVVVTSSCAAIYGDAIDCQSMPNGTLTEEIWNTTSRLDHQAYSYSKTQAEKAAWDIAKAQDRWKLVVINPAFVMGPGVTLQPNSESVAVMKQLGDGTMKMGVPHFEIGIVDVRDVAAAHMRAGYIADAEGRHITSAKTMTLLEMGQTLEKKFGSKWPFPKSTAPKWLLWLVGPIANKMFTREMISKNVGHAWKADNTKSKEKLDITYRSTETAVIEMFDQMIDAGVFKK
ncbi:NAD-dependent epimerase/dehydratase family protein [Lentilitoribacter sp. Alg239-R112]|uniref:NAD-dependent epimerase/dehydratase family protein n=1 Tax=Lentilitoribacter sp. Alg239-R112 TaxID=2305987 RepID=UPI0013A6FCFF|nr:NAD-dependent epimerase/dehydratase family protein [Lentilitoribacter sp. Alg239-R112]